MPATPQLPAWAEELALAYESGAHGQFILYGNVHDRFVLGDRLLNLYHYLQQALLGDFAVLCGYDQGNGLRVERGGEHLARWQREQGLDELPRSPLLAIQWISHFLRYQANLHKLGQGRPISVACVLRGVDQILPNGPSGRTDLGALTALLRDWAGEAPFCDLPFASFLIADNLADLHPQIGYNPRAVRMRIPLPAVEALGAGLRILAGRYPAAFAAASDANTLAPSLAGITLAAAESLVKRRHHQRQSLDANDLLDSKKDLIEQEAGGLVELIDSRRTLDDYQGQPLLLESLRQDMALWRSGDLRALPKGYLICGPVGTGKSFLVECLAGEAGVPVLKLKNFRDRWIGSSEGNLEKIFRLARALGRCILFIDEADQTLGRRQSGSGDSGLSGRIYAMIAEEMGSSATRGRIIWVLASSRPDLIEVDLKRPGRVDIKVPVLPAVSLEERRALLAALLSRYQLQLSNFQWQQLDDLLPTLLTPGAAEAIAVKTYRNCRLRGEEAAPALRAVLTDWQPPVPADVLEAQMRIAIAEASDLSFVPAPLRPLAHS